MQAFVLFTINFSALSKLRTTMQTLQGHLYLANCDTINIGVQFDGQSSKAGESVDIYKVLRCREIGSPLSALKLLENLARVHDSVWIKQRFDLFHEIDLHPTLRVMDRVRLHRAEPMLSRDGAVVTR